MRKTVQGLNTLLLTATLLVLFLSGCTGEEPLQPVSLPQSLPRSMKGYELYSWKSGRAWRFTLITGTNRLKTLAEITSPESVVEDDWVKITVEGVSELKAVLDRLPSDAQVVWSGDRDLPSGSLIRPARLELPPGPLIEEIRSHSTELGIQLNVSR
jgi:hypothetical protein